MADGDYKDRWYEAESSREMVKTSVGDFKDVAVGMAEKATNAFGAAPTQGVPMGVEPVEVEKPSGMDWVAQTLPPLTFSYTLNNLHDFDLGSGTELDPYQKPTDLASSHDNAYHTLFNDISGWDLTRFLPDPADKPELEFGTPPTVTVPEIGDQLPIEAPDRPELSALTVPDAPGYTKPTIGIAINPAKLPVLSNQFNYGSERYQPQYLTAVVTKAQSMMAGAMLVPPHVWDAMWSRAQGRLARQVHGALLDADTEFAARGWGRPGGSLNAARARIRSEAMGKAQDINLEKSIQQAAQVREDAIKGLDLLATIDSVLEVFHAHHEERSLKAAVEANNAALAVYDAAVKAYQVTELAAKQLQVAVDDLKIKNELGEQEAYDRLLKGIEIVSRIDINKVELFKAAWAGEETKQKAFLAWVESVKTNVEAQKTAVEAYAENAKAQQTRMLAYISEFDGYVKYLEGTKTKAALADARSSHFGRRVGYFQAADQSEAHRHEADIQRLHKIPLERSQMLLEKHKSELQDLVFKLDALLKPFATQYQALGTLTQGEAARTGTLTQQYDTEVRRGALTLQQRVESVKETLGYWQTYQQAWTGWQSAYAGVLGQVSSAFASATNISFGAASNIGFSDGQSSTFSFSRSRGYDVNIGVQPNVVDGSLDLNPPL